MKKSYGHRRALLLVVLSLMVGTGLVFFCPKRVYAVPDACAPDSHHCYEVPDMQLSWPNARDYCAKGRGGHLVTIGSAVENAFVYGLNPDGWIGFTDEFTEGNWYWVTGEPVGYVNWAPGEPDNCRNGCGGQPPNSQVENYAHFQTNGWHDWSYAESSFACEWESPAEYARSVVGKPYLLGGKGFDATSHIFVDSSAIAGLDCSGLVFWAYNKAVGATAYVGSRNPVQYESADGQYRYNSSAIDKKKLQAGDLLFFDWNRDGRADHVVMFVGDNSIVSAQSSSSKPQYLAGTIALFSYDDYMSSREQFLMTDGYRRITAPTVGFRAQVHSPVDLAVANPTGLTITSQTKVVTDEEILKEIPGEFYYLAWDSDGSGDLDASVVAPNVVPGKYTIEVTPQSSAPLTATYSLDVEMNGVVRTLAKDVQIADIPQKGYGILVYDLFSLFLPLIGE